MRTIATRVRTLRLRRGWTQEVLAARAGIKVSTYRRFERTGQISFERLLHLAIALDATGDFDDLFRQERPRTLDEVEAPKRKRGKRRDAKT